VFFLVTNRLGVADLRRIWMVMPVPDLFDSESDFEVSERETEKYFAETCGPA
jgi:hypothetical protein